jgi:GT2 family glycosyltransferase
LLEYGTLLPHCPTDEQIEGRNYYFAAPREKREFVVASGTGLKRPLVSAVIANFNGAGHLRLCLPSLTSQTYKSLEIIVVDNASSDDSSQVVRDFGVTWLGLPKNVGLAPALNRGAEVAKGDFLLFLNNDMRFDHNFVAALADPFAHDNTVFATDGMQYPWEGGDPVHIATRLTKTKPWRPGYVELVPGLCFYQEYNADITEALFASAACMMVRKRFFQILDGFDERLPLGYEDAEICWRARLNDWKVLFVPQAVCWHRVGGSSRTPEAALLNFRGIVRGRLVLSTKLLPFEYSLRTWSFVVAGFARDLSHGRWRFAIARAETLFRTVQDIPELLRERKILDRNSKKTLTKQLESLLQLGKGSSSVGNALE